LSIANITIGVGEGDGRFVAMRSGDCGDGTPDFVSIRNWNFVAEKGVRAISNRARVAFVSIRDGAGAAEGLVIRFL
jgi:hypothetical protein